MNLQQKIDAAKKLLAVVMGCVIAILLVIIVDKTFGWSMNIKESRSRFFPRSDDIDGLGWSAKTEKTLRETAGKYSRAHKEVFNGETIYDVTYNFDTLYRRLVPGQPDQNLDKFIIFFGGSQTFGLGLNDWDTIPAFVQKDTLTHRVYNYAYAAYGPHEMLKILETYKLPDELIETRGIAFFQYFTFHIPRVLGAMRYISWAGAGAPYYHVNSKDQLEYSGSFATGRFFKTLFYWLLGKSTIAKYYNVDMPATLTHHHYDLVCRVLGKSRDVFLDQYPASRFVVIIGITSAQNDPFIEECLETNNIEYVDMRKHYKSNIGLTFQHDGHFTPKAARLTAQQLAPLVY